MTHHATKSRRKPVPDLNVRRAQAGDLQAFQVLYQQHVGRVHALVGRMCGNGALAEELTQETFVRAWRKLDRFRGDAAFSTWLHRVAVNVVLDAQKRERRRAPTEWPPTPASAPRLGRIDLERAIQTLPTKARQVFILHDLEGYTHPEIGAVMSISVGTSRSQLHRARQLLREVLQ